MDQKNKDEENRDRRSICKDEDDDSNSSNDQDKDQSKKLDGVYDPNKFECPDAPIQVKNLFVFITHYSPQTIEIVPRLKSFIPEYIPTVGHVDAFIKIPYPDNRNSELGLTKLDEPNVDQSDTNLLQLKLKALSKKIGYDKSILNKTKTSEWINDPVVPLIRSTSSMIKDIDKWIENIEQLHETTARPESVSLLQQQPDHENINNLMQEWPEELETTLNVHSIPTPELDCSLEEYISILSAILDIPIQNNKIATLHLIFSLLNEFQNSQHFNKYEQN